jgi:hypothetical protein
MGKTEVPYQEEKAMGCPYDVPLFNGENAQSVVINTSQKTAEVIMVELHT